MDGNVMNDIRFRQFNLNNYVRVRLTDHGRRIHRENHAINGGASRYMPPKEDAEGWSTWQAWELMKEFGPHIGLLRAQPFDMNAEIQA